MKSRFTNHLLAALTFALGALISSDLVRAQAVTSPSASVTSVAETAEHNRPGKIRSPENVQNNQGENGKDHTSGPTNDQGSDPFGVFTSSNRGPIHIHSDSLALDYKHSAVQFRGHVHATQADGVLTSNTLYVKYGKDFHQVDNMNADGNVHISQGVRWCSSQHAVMDQHRQTVVLTGSPICHDARDQIAGTKITVHLDTGKSDVEAANAMIFPQPAKSRDNEAVAAQAK